MKAIKLHDLVLSQARWGLGRLHRLVLAGRRDVLDERDSERTSSVLVSSKFGDGCFGSVRGVEFDHTGPARAAIEFVLDLGPLNLSDRGEEIDKVLVARGPRELNVGSASGRHQKGIQKLTFRT